jgi:hypothetical protein
MSHGGPVLQGQMVVGGEHYNGERGSEADGSSGWRWWSSEPPRLPIGCRVPARAGPPPGGFVARAGVGVVGREGDTGVAAGTGAPRPDGGRRRAPRQGVRRMVRPPPGGFEARARAGVVGREGDTGVAAGASRASCTDSLSGPHQTSLEYGPHDDFSPRHQHCLWCFLYYCG